MSSGGAFVLAGAYYTVISHVTPPRKQGGVPCRPLQPTVHGHAHLSLPV